MLRQAFACAAIVSLGLIGAIDAQQSAPASAPPIKRTPLQRVDVPGTNMEVVFGMAEFVPNARTGRHTHPGAVLAYVAEGEFVLLADGEAEKRFKAGESFQVPAGLVHNEGAGNAPLKVMAVYVIEKGKPLASPAQ